MSLHPAGWIARASASNALATATKAAVSGRQHVVFGVTASFSAAAAGKLMVIKDGTTEVFRAYVTNQLSIDFPRGIAITPGAACSAELEAGGSAVVGEVDLHGATI